MEISISRERVRTSRLASIKMDIISYTARELSWAPLGALCFLYVDSKQGRRDTLIWSASNSSETQRVASVSTSAPAELSGPHEWCFLLGVPCSCHFSIVDLIGRAHIGGVYLATWLPWRSPQATKMKPKKLLTESTENNMSSSTPVRHATDKALSWLSRKGSVPSMLWTRPYPHPFIWQMLEIYTIHMI